MIGDVYSTCLGEKERTTENIREYGMVIESNFLQLETNCLCIQAPCSGVLHLMELRVNAGECITFRKTRECMTGISLRTLRKHMAPPHIDEQGRGARFPEIPAISGPCPRQRRHA